MIDSSTTIEVQKWFSEYFVHIKRVCEEYKINPASSGIEHRLKELRAAAAVGQPQVEHAYDSSMNHSNNVINTVPLPQQRKGGSSLVFSSINMLVKCFHDTFNVMFQSLYGLDYKDRVIMGLLLVLSVLIIYCIHHAAVLKSIEMSINMLLASQLKLEKELRELQQCR